MVDTHSQLISYYLLPLSLLLYHSIVCVWVCEATWKGTKRIAGGGGWMEVGLWDGCSLLCHCFTADDCHSDTHHLRLAVSFHDGQWFLPGCHLSCPSFLANFISVCSTVSLGCLTSLPGPCPTFPHWVHTGCHIPIISIWDPLTYTHKKKFLINWNARAKGIWVKQHHVALQ